VSGSSIERLGTLAEIERVRGEWRDLLARDPRGSIFQSPALYLAWLRTRRTDATPAALLLRNGGRLAAVAPTILRTVRVRGVRARWVEFCVPRGWIVAPGDRAAAIRDVLVYWRERTDEWDLFRLHHVPEAETEEIARAAEELGGLSLGDGGVAPAEAFLPTTQTWQEHLRGVSQKHRKTVQYNERTVTGLEGFAFDVLSGKADPDRVFETILDLEARSWKASRGSRLSPEEADFFRALLRDASGEAPYQMTVLRAHGASLACLLCFRCGERMYAFLTYYDRRYEKQSIGSWIMTRLMEQCFDDPGIRELSFVSDFRTAKRWTDRERTYRHVHLYHRGPVSRLLRALDRIPAIGRRLRDDS
jgi:CelD/BcsL family acetyltransferase involved in cellulose biosynthesis